MRDGVKLGLMMLGVGVVNSIVHGHPGHAHRAATSQNDAATTSPLRTWTATNGAFLEQGSFVMARDGRVQIRRDDDSLVTLSIALLADADQAWIRQRLSEIRVLAVQNGLDPATVQRSPWPEVREPDRTRSSGALSDSFLPATLPKLPRLKTDNPLADFLVAQAGDRNMPRNQAGGQPPAIAAAFEAFVKLKAIQTRWDDRFFYVESNGMPDHPMMIGITAWQQQVPLPQKYVGGNAWQIPLHPVPAETPATTRNRFLRGAIAIAVNGIPIFNPLNNRGDDAFLFGELDEYGGHCGRADDYHYHIAPVHLEKTSGKGKPIAYALDGYPIYGYDEPDGSPVRNLDALNGHKDARGNYHYHATKTYPYLNGGFHGVVTERDGQVDPQPRAEPLRPALPPLRDVKITGFRETQAGSYLLTYDVRGSKGTVSYTLAKDGTAKFVFVDSNGRTTQETYSPRQRGPGGGDRRPPPRPGDRPPRDNDPQSSRRPAGQARQPEARNPALQVSSASVSPNGFLSGDCTCDGKRQSPAVAWKGAPQETRAFAVSLWHTAPDQEKSYWLVYDIPATCQQIAQNARPDGSTGLNDRRKPEYDPLCSKGPGIKTYHLTVYALSRPLNLPADKVTRASLLEAIQKITLAEGTLDFDYERKGR